MLGLFKRFSSDPEKQFDLLMAETANASSACFFFLGLAKLPHQQPESFGRWRRVEALLPPPPRPGRADSIRRSELFERGLKQGISTDPRPRVDAYVSEADCMPLPAFGVSGRVLTPLEGHFPGLRVKR